MTDEEGSMITLWNPMVPGQLNYVLLGEFASGEHPWGFGQGYYLPLWIRTHTTKLSAVAVVSWEKPVPVPTM